MTQEVTREQLQQTLQQARERVGLGLEGQAKGPVRLGEVIGRADDRLRERLTAIASRAVSAPAEPFLPQRRQGGACPTCGGEGYILTPTGPTEVRAEVCHCEIQRRLARAAKAARMPEDAENWTFDNLKTPDGQPSPDGDEHNLDVVAAMKGWLADVDRNLRAGNGFYLYGRAYGAGKTYLAGALANACLQLRRPDLSVLWLAASKVGAMFRDTFDQGEGAELRLTQQLETAGLLLLDDLDKVQATAFVISKLWAIIDGRFADRKPVVITANVAPGVLAKRFGKEAGLSMASRILGRCEVFGLGGPDRRLLQRPGSQGVGAQ